MQVTKTAQTTRRHIEFHVSEDNSLGLDVFVEVVHAEHYGWDISVRTAEGLVAEDITCGVDLIVQATASGIYRNR